MKNLLHVLLSGQNHTTIEITCRVKIDFYCFTLNQINQGNVIDASTKLVLVEQAEDLVKRLEKHKSTAKNKKKPRHTLRHIWRSWILWLKMKGVSIWFRLSFSVPNGLKTTLMFLTLKIVSLTFAGT